jgi:hypothetical protein
MRTTYLLLVGSALTLTGPAAEPAATAASRVAPTGGVARLRAGDDGSGVSWCHGLNWPWWSHHVNGLGRIAWSHPLETGQAVERGCAGHYCWR